MNQKTKLRNAVFAEKPILDQLQCKVTKIDVDPSDGLPSETLEHPSGWKFTSFHRHILNKQEINQTITQFTNKLQEQFPSIDKTISNDHLKDIDHHEDHIDINGYKLHLPPVLFGVDKMRLTSPNGTLLSIDALDAVYSWIVKHSKERIEEEPLEVIKVPYSQKWTRRISEGFAVSNEPLQSIHTPTHHKTRNELLNETPVLTNIQASDWTYSTDYCFTLNHTNDAQKSILTGHQLKNHLSDLQPSLEEDSLKTFTCQPLDQSGIDYEMLKRRDLPILFYDEFILYEDDLEDCGEVSCEAKIRVMPTCWFLLLKFFLRIDHVIVKCREVRLFHVFETKQDDNNSIKLFMEVIWREKNIDQEELVNSRVPMASGASFPVHRSLNASFHRDNTNELPIINDKLSLPQNYLITLKN